MDGLRQEIVSQLLPQFFWSDFFFFLFCLTSGEHEMTGNRTLHTFMLETCFLVVAISTIKLCVIHQRCPYPIENFSFIMGGGETRDD